MTARRTPRRSSKKLVPPVRGAAKPRKKRPRKTAPGALATAPATASLGQTEGLSDRVVSILEEAQGRVVRAVNTQVVTAYWLIGKEIVQALQGGDARAEYRARMLVELPQRLTERYGKGFSLPNLKNFRQFYVAYSARRPRIGYPSGSQLLHGAIRHPPGDQSVRRRLARSSGTQPVAFEKGAQ
jgi:hypothetical protein